MTYLSKAQHVRTRLALQQPCVCGHTKGQHLQHGEKSCLARWDHMKTVCGCAVYQPAQGSSETRRAHRALQALRGQR